MSAPTTEAIQSGWSFPFNTSTEQIDCLICASPAQDACHVAPCGHRLGCWNCVRNGLDQLHKCWLCRHPVTALVQESTGKMVSVESTHILCVEQSDDHMVWEDRIPVTWPSRTLLPIEASIMRRMYIYHHHLFSAHVGANRTSGYREITPGRFRNNVELQGRAKAFLRRELRVFAYLARNHGHRRPRFLPLSDGVGPDATFGCLPGDEPDIIHEVERNVRYFLTMLKSLDLKGCTGAAERAVENQLSLALSRMDDSQTVVRLFLHELRAFLRSPYTSLKDWDANARYDAPPRGAARLPRLRHGTAASARARVGHSPGVGSQQQGLAQGAPAVPDTRSAYLERIAHGRPSSRQSYVNSDGAQAPIRRAPVRRAPLPGPPIPPFPSNLFADSWSDYIDFESGWRFIRRIASGLEDWIATGSSSPDNESITSGNANTARTTTGGWSSNHGHNEPSGNSGSPGRSPSTARSASGGWSSNGRLDEPASNTGSAGGGPSTTPPAHDDRGSWDFVGTITSSTNAEYDIWSLNTRQPEPQSTTSRAAASSGIAQSAHGGWSASRQDARATLSTTQTALSRAQDTLSAARAALETAESTLDAAEATISSAESPFDRWSATDSTTLVAPSPLSMTQTELYEWQYPTSNRRRSFRSPHLHRRARRTATSNRMRTWRGMDS